jgi:hypothetical protein
VAHQISNGGEAFLPLFYTRENGVVNTPNKKKGEVVTPLPRRLDMPIDSGAPTLHVPFHSPFVNVHTVSDLAVRQAVYHTALQCFPVPCVVAPFVDTVGNFRVGGHVGHSSFSTIHF